MLAQRHMRIFTFVLVVYEGGRGWWNFSVLEGLVDVVGNLIGVW